MPLLTELLRRLDVEPLPTIPEAPKRMAEPFALKDSPPHAQPMIDIEDPRPIDSTQKVGRAYPRAVIDSIAQAAQAEGVDPALATAMGIQETGLGTAGGGQWTNNPLHLNLDATRWEHATPEEMDQVLALPDLHISPDAQDAEERDIHNRIAMRYLKRQMDKHPDDLTRAVQGYNGYGKPNSEEYGSQLYGEHVDDLPPNVYGERILDLKQHVVDQNPLLLELLKRPR